MKIEDLVAQFKEQGLTDEQINETLLQIKVDIDKYLGTNDQEAEEKDEIEAESEEDIQKRHDVFNY